MKSKRIRRIGIAGVVAVAVPSAALLAAGHAFADYEPSASDVVAVGGDTPQYALQFLADGDTSGDLGYNAAGDVNKLVVFTATADGNGRSSYTNSATSGGTSSALNPTVVLRAGEFPVARPQSSGQAITALLDDTANPEEIDFVFSASEPTAAQNDQAPSSWKGLHVVQIGTDSDQIAVDSTSSNAPLGLDRAELLWIYTQTDQPTWAGLAAEFGLSGSDFPGGSIPGAGIDIDAYLPPSGSSIYKTFIADLTTANGNTAPSIGTWIKTVEQNDPSEVSSDPNGIVPFSQARLNLWNDGYFHKPSTTFTDNGALTLQTAGVKLLAGAPGTTANDSGTGSNLDAYASPITDYVIFRQSDAGSATPFEPGGTLNWVATLFSTAGDPDGVTTTPFVESTAGQALLAASGITPDYVDLGVNPLGS